jgi:hypothetical protein
MTKEARAPVDVRCEWKRRENEPGVYDCSHCGSWTANMPLYRYVVCSARDRRKRSGGRREADRP